MRIAKYIFLLLLLLSIAFIVFIATQPNEFNYKSEKTIASPKNTIFQYINDYKNWNSWYPELNFSTKTSHSEITNGEGAFIKWDETKITTTHLFSNDSIYQLEQEGDKKYSLYWKFQEEKGETKVIWGIKGNLTFNEKLFAFLKGGNEFIYTSKIEEGLEKINDYLVNEISNFNILINGVVNNHASYNIQQKDSCSLAEFPLRSNKALQNLQKFVKQNDIIINGDAFIQFSTWNINNEPLYFAACIPIEEEILTTPLSDITGHYQEEYSALKITLKGSYSHRKEAWKKALAFIKQNEEYILDQDYKITEIHKKDRSNTTKPSEFITEILIPVKAKNSKPKTTTSPLSVTKPVVNQKIDSIR
ncbi:hypothetical protein FIA58_000895 [Flavobacterium jejuense]|uniref:AraC effector-binding domain-containing protein n=1 Tax=Flavobacterium jejuense TaxID=1544455 RepID=A0ABX0IMH1_9FLAO|nr:SRPBCC family protein [Flavobacterium jejuense]NHN24220.1 hypothetical protein [Flavobacterium jejuense]